MHAARARIASFLASSLYPVDTSRPSSRTKWTRRVPHPVLIGHVSSLSQVATGERVFEDQNANSVAWNSVLEEQLCYSGKDQLSIKTGDFPIHRERMQGFVVGVRASKVFCLHYLAMDTLSPPLLY